MKITAKDLAQALNISPAAVSLALNNKPGVSDETRAKVWAAAREAGYTAFRQDSEKSFSMCLQYVIYVKFGSVVRETTFHSIVMRGIEAQCKKLGYGMRFSYFYENQSWPEQLRAISHNTAGIILLGTELSENDIDVFKPLNLPIVVVDNPIGYPDYDCVVNDSAAGAYNAIRYLISKGHTKIWYLCSKQKIVNFTEREKGVLKALASDPRTKDLDPVIVPVDITGTLTAEDISAFIAEKKEFPTAVFADNDLLAATAIRVFKQHGLQVPDQISIIGYDHLPIADMIDPPMTTVHVHKESMGATAVNLLHERIRGERNYNVLVTIMPPILEQKSVLPYPAD